MAQQAEVASDLPGVGHRVAAVIPACAMALAAVGHGKEEIFCTPAGASKVPGRRIPSRTVGQSQYALPGVTAKPQFSGGRWKTLL